MNAYPDQRAYYLYVAKTQITEPELKRTLIVMADHIGKDDPILIGELARLIYDDPRNERQSRDDLERLRNEHDIPIGSNSGKAGRWIVVDPEDLHHTANEIESRGYKMLSTARKMRQTPLRPTLTPQAMAEVATNQGRFW